MGLRMLLCLEFRQLRRACTDLQKQAASEKVHHDLEAFQRSNAVEQLRFATMVPQRQLFCLDVMHAEHAYFIWSSV